MDAVITILKDDKNKYIKSGSLQRSLPAMKYKLLILALIIATISSISGIGQNIVSIKSLLNEMTSYESVARWPQPGYILKQASSYDRKSVSPGKPGWFANADASQYIRTEEKDGH